MVLKLVSDYKIPFGFVGAFCGFHKSYLYFLKIGFQKILIMFGPLQDEWRTTLEVVNYFSTVSAAAIALIDIIKSGFNPMGIQAL